MGSAKDRHDNHGREKVQCQLCKKWFHRLDAHLTSRHEGTEAYKKKFPDSPLVSEWARKDDERKGNLGGDDNTFKFGPARLKQRELEDDEKRFVPVHDENWVLGSDEREALEALALAIQDDENVLIQGPPGIGKSTLVKELASITDNPLRRIAFRGDMRASDLIGSKTLFVDKKTGQSITGYEDAILPNAAPRGHWMLVDEIDAGPPEVMFLLHPVLENPRSLLLSGKDGGVQVEFDDRFRFVATANTLGWGDETGLFAGTTPMNEALLDRFGTVIKMDYPAPDNEIERIVQRSGCTREVATKMVTVAKMVREAQKKDTTTASLSPRRLIMWSRKSVRMGDPVRAARYTVTNRLPAEESTYVAGIIQRVFGGRVS